MKGKPSWIRASLRTRSPEQALFISRSLSYVACLIVSRGRLSGMRFEEIKKALNGYFKYVLDTKREQMATLGNLTQEQRARFEEGVAYGTTWFDLGLPGSPQLQAFFDWSKIKVAEGSKEHDRIRTEYEGAYSLLCQRILDYDNHLSHYDFAEPIAVAIETSRNESSKKSTLSEVIGLFIAEQQDAGLWGSPKTLLDKGGHFALLQEKLNSNIYIADITSSDALNVKATLLKLPKNRNKMLETRDLTLDEVVALDHPEKLSTKTKNQYLITYSSLFEWAKRHSYVKDNHFKGLAIKRKKLGKNEARHSYSYEQFQTILNEVLSNKRGLIKKPYQKWGPLIAMYTGARLNEIAQLNVDDIRFIDGSYWFDLNEIGLDKRLKTGASARLVPVHHKLLEAGFLAYIGFLHSEKKRSCSPSFLTQSKLATEEI